MKKIIILLLAILLSACSAVKPAETVSSMQTEPKVTETTVADTPATAPPEEVAETTTKEAETKPSTPETVSEVPKDETPEPSVSERPEKKSTPENTTAETSRAPETPVEAVKVETPTEIPETVKTPSESVTEPSKTEFDVNYWIDFATAYALQIGLEIDETAVDCWDNPTTANADCIYLERDLTSRLNRYNRDEDITAVNIWAESLGNGKYLIYIAYA